MTKKSTKSEVGRELYPVVDSAVWATRYGLIPDESPCSGCGKTIITDRPFAFGAWRGLLTADHGCGLRSQVSVAKAFGSDGKSLYAGFVF